MRKFVLGLIFPLAIVALAFLPIADASTVAIVGQRVIITGATAATPIVLTTGLNTLVANDWVYVTGVNGLPQANGTWQCSAVDSTHCTLLGSIGAGLGPYTDGGNLTPLAIHAATTTGPWFSVGKADRVNVQIWNAAAGGTGTVLIEGSSQPNKIAGLNGGITSPATLVTAIADPSAAGSYTLVGGGSTKAIPDFIRVVVTAVATPSSMYATIDAYSSDKKLLADGVPQGPPPSTRTPTFTPTPTPTVTETTTPNTATPTRTFTNTPTVTPTKTVTPATQTLTIGFNGNATGQSVAYVVNGTPGTTCLASAAPCTRTPPNGATIILTASGGSNATITGTGAASGCGGANPCTFTMTGTAVATARY